MYRTTIYLHRDVHSTMKLKDIGWVALALLMFSGIIALSMAIASFP